MAASLVQPIFPFGDDADDGIGALTEYETIAVSPSGPRPELRIRLSRRAHLPWLGAVIKQLDRILALEEGWDSYGGRRIKHAAVRGVIDLLDRLGGDVAPPVVFPASDGAVVVEWNTPAGALEIKVENESRISFFAEDVPSGHKIEEEGLTQARFFADFYQKISHLVPRA